MKQLRLDEAIGNLTFSDLEILVVVTGLGVTGLKKTEVVYLLGFFFGRGGRGRSGGVISCVWSALG